MFEIYETGPIQLNQEGTGRLITPRIEGKIIKIGVKFNEESGAEDSLLQVWTPESEKILTVMGNQSGLWYPRNWNVMNQKYSGITDAPEGTGALSAEPYFVLGNLFIELKASISSDYIKNMVFFIEGRVIKEQRIEIQKKGMMTTNTTGIHNAVHNRRKYLKKYFENISKEITKNKKETSILKSVDYDDLRKYIEENLYDRSFSGISKSMSELIKDYILRSVVKKYDQSRVMKYLERKGVPRAQAANIYRTENQALRTKVREWSYKRLDPEGELKYKWLGPKDHRTTKICKTIQERTNEGVSLEELREVIQEEVDKAKERGELPEDYDAREYTPHFGCRHTFVRAF